MSFASMHDDYLDPDRHLWPEEPPCDNCKHDTGNACAAGDTCTYIPKVKPVTYHIKTLSGEYVGRSLKGWILVASYANAWKFLTEDAACAVCTQELAERLKVFMAVCSSEEP